MSNKIAIIILLVIVCLGGAFYFYNKAAAPVEPAAQITEKGAAALGQTILNGEVYITPLEVISDSRCPVDVTCIWAGEVSLRVRLEKSGVSKEVILKLQTPVQFEGDEITLRSVTPENNTKKPFTKEDYRFNFISVPIPLPPVGTGTVSGTVTLSPIYKVV